MQDARERTFQKLLDILIVRGPHADVVLLGLVKFLGRVVRTSADLADLLRRSSQKFTGDQPTTRDGRGMVGI